MGAPKDSYHHDVFMEKLKEGKRLTQSDIYFIAHNVNLEVIKSQIQGSFTEDTIEEVCAYYAPHIDPADIDSVIECIQSTYVWLSNPAENPQLKAIQKKIKEETSVSMYEQEYLGQAIFVFACTQENADFDALFESFTSGLDAIETRSVYQALMGLQKWMYNQ